MTADVKAKQRKPTNVSLDAELLQEAKNSGSTFRAQPSQVCVMRFR